jgi:hypothetical protein
LQKFHTAFSDGCAAATMDLNQINGLIAAF